MKQQIESYKESQDSNLGIIKQLEANISSLNQTKDENVNVSIFFEFRCNFKPETKKTNKTLGTICPNTILLCRILKLSFFFKEAKLKLIKENNQLLKRELETLRHSFNATQMQLQKLQDTLINKEIKQPANNTESYVKIDSEEFKRYINCEIDRYKELSKLEMNQQIEK
jgi:hypothetical protein